MGSFTGFVSHSEVIINGMDRIDGNGKAGMEDDDVYILKMYNFICYELINKRTSGRYVQITKITEMHPNKRSKRCDFSECSTDSNSRMRLKSLGRAD